MAFEGSNQIKTQKWMEILENKNQKGHKLAHDLGAGSPCLQCKDKCPGLDLHFWRKVCKNCKCKKESHDVQEEDDISAKFEILFGASKCIPSQAVLDLKLRFPGDPEEEGIGESGVRHSSSYPKREYTFDWIPPNISSELAAEYMQQLPANKLPISGSDGALYRRQQLEKQVPLHDLNSNLCHNLTTDEVKALTDYLENLKQNVVGQGMIMKLPTLLPSEEGPLSSLPPASSNMPTSYSADAISSLYNTVPKPFRLGGGDSSANQIEPEFPPPPPELLEDTPASAGHSFLKPPSAFIKKSRTPSPTSCNQQTAGMAQNLAHQNVGLNTGTAQDPNHLRDSQNNPSAKDEDENKNVKVSDFIRSLNSKQTNHPGVTIPSMSHDIREDYQKPSEHLQHNLNNNRSTGNESNINENNVESARRSPSLPQQAGFEPKPYVPTTSSLKIESFNQMNEPVYTPNRMIAKHLDNQHQTQRNVGYNTNQLGNRTHDPSGTMARDETNRDNVNQSVRVTNLDDLVDDLSQVNLNGAHAIQDARNGNMPCGNYATKRPSGKSCKQCELPIHSGELAIYTEKLGENILWHPNCFVCSTCNELLVDLMYFHYKNNVYCLRDYAQMLDIPRCHACDELIFVNEYTLAENKTFHVKHFCCYLCDKELCNQSYIPVTPLNQESVGSHPYCLDCYYANFSKTCAACDQVIDVKDKCIQFNDKYYWHIRTECFACTYCKKYLNNEKFMMQFEKPFCSRQCVLGFSDQQL
ncbi:hypothetical protein WDU94_009989 [Cyamophila willieti]